MGEATPLNTKHSRRMPTLFAHSVSRHRSRAPPTVIQASEWIIVDVRVRLTFLALMRRPAVDLRQGAAHEFGAL